MNLQVIWIAALLIATCAEDVHDHDDHAEEPWPRNGVDRWEFEGAFTASIVEDHDEDEVEDQDDHEGHGHLRALEEEKEHGDVLLLAKGKTATVIHEGHAEQELVWADSSMAILIMPIVHTDHDDVEAVEDEAGELWEHALEVGGNKQTLTYPMADGASLLPKVVYELSFDAHAFITAWPINMNTSYAIFAQHDLAEFRMPGTDHVMKNNLGREKTQVEAQIATTAAGSSGGLKGSELLGQSVGAALLTSIASLAGIAFILLMKAGCCGNGDEWLSWSGSFAVGALVACAGMLMIPEAHLMLAGYVKEESSSAWMLGSSIALGWLTGVFCEWFSNTDDLVKTTNDTVVRDIESALEKGTKVETAPAPSDEAASTKLPFGKCNSLGVAVLWGDLFHNFIDGVMIAIAFKSCSSSMGWSITAASVAHEVPQELADFMILTTGGKMSYTSALIWNFISSLSCVLGALIACGVDMNGQERGWLLGYGAGTYLYIAFSQLAPISLLAAKGPKQQLINLFWFILAMVAIGLVLLDHEHCTGPPVVSADGLEVDPHAGHNH
jgi:zinc transporter ZupT